MDALAVGTRLLQEGRPIEALAAFERELRVSPTSVDAALGRGFALLELARTQDAGRAFKLALECSGDDGEVYLRVAGALRRTGLVALAVDAHRLGVARMGRKTSALERLDFARTLCSAHLFEEALAVLGEDLLTEPTIGSDARAIRADILERTNRLRAAEEALQVALANSPTSARALLVQARVRRRRGHLEAAERSLQAPVWRESPIDAETLIGREFELGKLLDLMSLHSSAAAHFDGANELQRGTPAFRAQDPGRLHGYISQMSAEVRRTEHGTWETADYRLSTPRSPLFVVGFPRSGTTLVTQVLRGHPSLAVAGETPMGSPLGEVVGELTAASGPGSRLAQRIMELTGDELRHLRDVYWEALDSLHGEAAKQSRTGAQLVDKLPMNIVYTPLIIRLWPDARFIFVARHPLDVALSNYMQHFRLNEATVHFTSLRATAGLYCSTLHLWQLVTTHMRPRVHQTRYEDLVMSPGATIGELSSFVVGDRLAIASERSSHVDLDHVVTTPSRDQVVRPIHATSVGRWTRYRQLLREVIPEMRGVLGSLGYAQPDQLKPD